MASISLVKLKQPAKDSPQVFQENFQNVRNSYI